MPYNQLDLVNNQIRAVIPFPAGYPTPEKLRYLAELYIPVAPDSETFRLLASLETMHRPPKNGVYKDAELYIEDYLKRQFDNPCPDGKPTEPAERIVRVPGAVLPYYVRYKRTPLDQNYTQMPTRYAIEAGLSFEEFPGNVFLTDVLPLTKMFLTWQPITKKVQPDQPEYLDFITNFTGLSKISLKVKAYLADGTHSTTEKASVSGVKINSVYRCAVGFGQLGLSQTVKRYDIWLENQDGNAISQVRTYEKDTRYQRNVKYLLFQNGLGGYDTLRLTGQSQHVLSVKSDLTERFLPADYTASQGEFEVSETAGETSLEIATGNLEKAYYNYLQDFFLSKKIYLLGKKGPLPYQLTSKDLPYAIDDETRYGLKLKLKAAFQTNNYSLIPDVTFTATQSYTASCPALQVGTPVTRSATATSTLSPADAQAKALAKARALAEADLVCTFAPAGVFIRTGCKPNTTELWSIVTNGSGGEMYGALLDAQAVACGFIAELNFTANTTPFSPGGVFQIPGLLTLDNFIGGDPNQPYEVTWNGGRTWTVLPNAGGLSNPQIINLPVGGLITITVRRGDRSSLSRDILMPHGTIGTSPSMSLVSNYNRPDLGPTKTALGITSTNGINFPDPLWVHFQISRRVDNNPFNNVLVRKGWFNLDDIYAAASSPTAQSPSIVSLPVISSGTQYDIVFLAGPTGYNLNSILLTIP